MKNTLAISITVLCLLVPLAIAVAAVFEAAPSCPGLDVFRHGSWLHLGFNLFLLWTVGVVFEREHGAVHAWGVFVTGAAAGWACHGLSGLDRPVWGISAAGIALFTAHLAAMRPETALRVRILFVPVRAHAQVLLVTWIACLWICAALQPLQPQIAHAAHFGGAAAGALFGVLLLRHRL